MVDTKNKFVREDAKDERFIDGFLDVTIDVTMERVLRGDEKMENAVDISSSATKEFLRIILILYLVCRILASYSTYNPYKRFLCFGCDDGGCGVGCLCGGGYGVAGGQFLRLIQMK